MAGSRPVVLEKELAMASWERLSWEQLSQVSAGKRPSALVGSNSSHAVVHVSRFRRQKVLELAVVQIAKQAAASKGIKKGKQRRNSYRNSPAASGT